MRLPPYEVLAKWPTPNSGNPHTRSAALVVLAAVFLAFVVIAVLGRFYSRIVLKRWAGLDDTMIGLALIFTIAMNVVVILANVRYGWNRHVWDLTIPLLEQGSIIAFVAKALFTLAATFTRLSLLCFYYRLVKDSGTTWFNWILHVNVAFSIAICISFICLTIWLCIPVQAYWTFPPIEGSKCLDEGTVMLAGGIVNCVADLLITILPIPIVMQLQMPLKQKIGVCALLCLGFMVTIAGILRTYFIWKSLIDSYDETWFSYPLWICAMVEIDVAVICACAPAWRSLVARTFDKARSRISSHFSSQRSPHHSDNSHETSQSSRSFSKWGQSAKAQISSLFDRDRSRIDDLEKSAFGGGGADARGRGDRMQKKPSQPCLQITKRQSIEQQSSYIGEDSITSSPRKSVGGVVPGQWFHEGRMTGENPLW